MAGPGARGHPPPPRRHPRHPRLGREATERLLAVEELTSTGLRHGLPTVTASITVGGTNWLLDIADGAAGQAPAEAVDQDRLSAAWGST